MKELSTPLMIHKVALFTSLQFWSAVGNTVSCLPFPWREVITEPMPTSGFGSRLTRVV